MRLTYGWTHHVGGMTEGGLMQLTYGRMCGMSDERLMRLTYR